MMLLVDDKIAPAAGVNGLQDKATDAAIQAGKTLLDHYGLVVVLIVIIVALVAASGWMMYVMIRWFQKALTDQRTDFVKALKDRDESLTTAMTDRDTALMEELGRERKGRKEDAALYLEQTRESRKDSLAESRAMRELTQQILNQLSLVRMSYEKSEGMDQGESKGRKKPIGGSGQ
jgi:hypothetical protein